MSAYAFRVNRATSVLAKPVHARSPSCDYFTAICLQWCAESFTKQESV